MNYVRKRQLFPEKKGKFKNSDKSSHRVFNGLILFSFTPIFIIILKTFKKHCVPKRFSGLKIKMKKSGKTFKTFK